MHFPFPTNECRHSFPLHCPQMCFYYTEMNCFLNDFPTEEVQQTIERFLRSKRHLNIDMPDTDRSDSGLSLSCCVTKVIHSDTDVHIVLYIPVTAVYITTVAVLGLCFLLGWCWMSLTLCSSWRRRNGHWNHFLEWWGLIVSCLLVFTRHLRWWPEAYTYGLHDLCIGAISETRIS